MSLGRVTLVVVVVAIAACGGDDDTVDSVATPGQPTDVPASTPVETMQSPSTTEVEAPTTTRIECDEGERRTQINTCVPDETTTTATTTTTLPPNDGSRERPFDLRVDSDGPDVLSTPEWDPILFLGPQDVDPISVEAANQFNDPPPAGQKYVQIVFLGTYIGEGTATGFDVALTYSLVGDKSKVYDAVYLSDTNDVLGLITEQPDVIKGGSLGGSIVYAVDVDDTNLLVTNGEQFVIPAAP